MLPKQRIVGLIAAAAAITALSGCNSSSKSSTSVASSPSTMATSSTAASLAPSSSLPPPVSTVSTRPTTVPQHVILTKHGVGEGAIGSVNVASDWRVAAKLSCGPSQTLNMLSGIDMKSDSFDFTDFVEFTGYNAEETSAFLDKTEAYTGKVNLSMTTDCAWTVTVTQKAYTTTPRQGTSLGRTSGCALTDLTHVKIPSGAPYMITDVYLAPSDPKWARFHIAPRTPGTADTLTGFAHCTAGGWTVVDYGSFATGCRTVPQQLRSELDVIEC